MAEVKPKICIEKNELIKRDMPTNINFCNFLNRHEDSDKRKKIDFSFE